MKRLAMLLLCMAACAAGQDYQISGVVVDHVTNRPLNHVLVQILRMGKEGGDASVVTEADGRFAFLHLPKGKYQLMAEKRQQNPQGFHADGGYATAIVVDGQQKTDGLIFPLRSDASISGTVTGDDGEPLRDAQLLLFRESVNEGEAQTIQTGGSGTNSSGHFHFGHLEAGRYFVSAFATPWFQNPGISNVVYPVTFYGDTTNGVAAQAIVLAEGGTANLQISLRAVPGISVKLADPTHGVGLFVPGPGGTRVAVPAGMMQANPGSDQTSMLINLAAGRYAVTVYDQRGGNDRGEQMVDLTNGSTLSVESSAHSVVTGQLVLDVAKPTGELSVFLQGGGQRGVQSAQVAADGTFRFENVAAGRYEVHLNSQALAVSAVTAKGARLVHDSLEVPAGASVELTIRAGARENLATIEGFAVRDAVGVPGAMVLLLPQDLGRARLIRRDQSDADGSFSLPSVLPGRYTLLAIDDGRELAYRNEAVIKPYLAGGLAVTIPMNSSEALKVPIQMRRR